jgi:ubiquinone/menaquinone biosynthesis C-methylase UbiE
MNHKIFRILFLISVMALLFPTFPMAQEYDWGAIDEESFESFQPTEKIMDIIGVKEEMTVGEVGAGGGRVAVRVAKRVGHSGKVYANDITASALQYMRDRIKRENITNMVVIEGTLTDPRFPKEELDVVYLTNTYRHLDKPVEVLENIKSSLKFGGRLAIIELKRYARITGSNEIVHNAELAGYRLIKVDNSLPRDDIYLFEIE